MSTAGRIAKWDINDTGLINTNGDSYIIQRVTFSGGAESGVMIGTNILPATTGLRAVARFFNEEPNTIAGGGTGTNHCVIIDASGADVNIALDMVGGIVTDGDQAITGNYTYDRGGDTGTLKFKNGLLVGFEHGD